MPLPEIINLSSTSWPEFRRLRLLSLQTDPQAFLTEWSTAGHYPDSYWQTEFSRHQQHTCFFHYSGLNVGLIGVYPIPFDHSAHVGEVVNVWLDPQYRGQGWAKPLLAKAILTLTRSAKYSKLRLSVSSSQKVAQAVYKSLGFSVCGRLHKDLKVGDNYLDLIFMEKILI